MKNCDLCKGRGWCGEVCDNTKIIKLKKKEARLLCLKCKGRLYCGRSFCPLAAKAEAMFKVKELTGKESFQGSAPAPFIGHYGYPNLNVGILSLQEQEEKAWLYDAPNYWAENNFEIKDVINFRTQLVNSRFKANIRDVGKSSGFSASLRNRGFPRDINKLLEINQEIGMASKPVDVEINLEDKPRFKVKMDAYTAPIGPNARLKKADITSNPKIHTKVEKVASDIDLKSADALTYLYENNFDENFLTKILSVGTLGLKKNRKLVPTRWSITAIDDTLGKYLIKQIKNFSEADYMAYFGGYLGNYYLILFFSEKWSYELFEMYSSNCSEYTTDYENYNGRKKYAEQCAGGYYSVRLSVLEKLRKIKRQGAVLVLRFITNEYAVPLGVWVTREAARKALNNKPISFISRELMLNYATALIKKKFGTDISYIFNKSIILRELKTQMKISNYF